jgi:hypothetical protein
VIRLHILVLSLAYHIIIIDQLRCARRALGGFLEKTCERRNPSISARLTLANVPLIASAFHLHAGTGNSTAPAYAGMPVMTPTSVQSAVTLRVSMTLPSLATISTKRGGSGSGGRFSDLWTMSLDMAGASEPAARPVQWGWRRGPKL